MDQEPVGKRAESEQGQIRTFLIADVRGWTSFTQQRGDEAAARLASKFAGIAREVVRLRGGEVIELRGDEALAVFSSARQAVRAAVDLQERFVEETVDDPELPMPVGIGLDAGEAVPVEGGYRGGALNLAARLCGQAKAGEILASRGVTHLARKVDGVRYLDKGTVRLKNLAEPVELVRVVPEGVDPADRLRVALPPQGPARRPRRAKVAVAAAVAAAVVATAFVLLRDDAPPTIAAGTVGLLDASGNVRGTVTVGERPAGLAVDSDALWITDQESRTVARADPSTFGVEERIPVGAGPTGVAVGSGFVWVANTDDRTVSVVDPQVHRVVETIVVGNGPTGIAVDDGRVWVANSVDGSVSEIDSSDFTVTETHRVGDRPVALAMADGAVWVVNQGSDDVSRVVPGDGETETIDVGRGPSAITDGAGSLWVTNSDDGTVSRIDPVTGSATDSDVGGSPVAVAVDQAGVWVANASDGTIERLDPATARIDETLNVGNEPRAVAGTDEGVWVGVHASTDAHRGGTLRVASVLRAGSLDPAVVDGNLTLLTPDEATVPYTNDGLVAFRKAGGAAGATVVPDIAVSLPDPTDGGRTYTFRLREGIRFSNGDVLTPQDVVATFERALVLPGDGFLLQPLLVGGSTCVPEDPEACDLSEGVVADEEAGTVSFHLVRPEPDLLNMLAIRSFSIVPAGTPLDLRGEPVPATGPYMISEVGEDGSLTLERNPEFHEWSADAQPDGFVDRIEYETGIERDAQVDLVDNGEADLTFDGVPRADVEELERRASDQLVKTPESGFLGVTLNTGSHPFDRSDARRAVAYALDRGELARIFGPTTGEFVENPVTCQIIPPNMPGHVPYCPFTGARPEVSGSWAGPDTTKARALVRRSGTGGAHVVVAASPLMEATGKQVEATLDELGYEAKLRIVDTKYVILEPYQVPANADVSLVAWVPIYASAVELFVPLLGCISPDGVTTVIESGGGFPFNLSNFCDPEIDRRVQRALDLQETDRYRAARAFAAIDRDLVDLAPLIPYATSTSIQFVSERVGNAEGNPQLGVLLSQMWVR
jgi:YVTN family beta-propeller protein